jgi:hypothetical protein
MGYIWDVTWSWEARIALTIWIGEAMSEWDHLEEQDDASTWFFRKLPSETDRQEAPWGIG